MSSANSEQVTDLMDEINQAASEGKPTNPLCQDCGEYQHQCACAERMRPLEADFYYDTANKVWVYKWSDSRLILTRESIQRYREENIPPSCYCICHGNTDSRVLCGCCT